MRPYRVYRNLTKRNYSVLSKVEGKWRKTDEADELTLTDCALLVYEAGRSRVIRERKKNVHAYICCESYIKESTDLPVAYQLSYNPYKGPEFVYAKTKHNKRIPAPTYIDCVTISEKGILTPSGATNASSVLLET